jgi:hypothetical protein
MALPYDASIANYLSPTYHSRIKDGGTWRWVDQVSVKSGGSWRTVKQAYVKSGGTWRKYHDAENVFTFYVTLDGTRTSTFNLGTWLSNSGYVSPSLNRTYNSGDRIKGVIHVTGTQGGNPGVYIGNFGGESRVYIKINSNCRIAGYGGNGSNIDGNGAGGGTALYTRTGVFIENNGNMWAGGGGGAGGANGQCVGTYYYNYNCGKNCYRQGTGYNYTPASGGSGGGGAGVPVGSGANAGTGGCNGSYNSGGNGGAGSGCGSAAGGGGGNPGAVGGNSTLDNGSTHRTGGSAGFYIDGANYVYSWVATGDRRGRTQNG